MKTIICSECGKEEEHEAKGLCIRCYKRLKYQSFTPEQMEHLNKTKREWYAKTITERRAYFRKYYSEHKEKMIASMIKWQKKERQNDK